MTKLYIHNRLKPYSERAKLGIKTFIALGIAYLLALAAFAIIVAAVLALVNR